MDSLKPSAEVGLEELVSLCAVDSTLFSHTFFPRTVRQEGASFHNDIWDLLEGNNRLVNIQVFRGGAKTSILRMYTAKRIAYGLAHTILYIGKSEGHAIRSIKWLRRQVEYNKQFAQVYGLRRGKKWQDVEAEIWHGTDEYPIWIMGSGITGDIRGINQDDFRPDLIVIDDALNEENSATSDQRSKISNLIYGALKESLAPESEAPDAKMVMLQTPQNKEDASTVALTDPEWKSASFGCWTAETADLPTHLQRSIWPARWPDATLRKEKEAAIRRNQLSLWLREKECKLISPETSAFNEDWLKFYDLEPEHMQITMAIDPVPPPSDIQIAKGLRGKDFEAFAVVGRHRGDYYLLEYSLNRGHEPTWTIAEFFRLAMKYQPRRIIVESVAYQRTLAWILRQAMQHQKRYFVIKETDDKRKKYDKIVDGLNGLSSMGHLFVSREHHEFIAQFRAYPDVSHDDLIEVVAACVSDLSSSGIYDAPGEEYEELIAQEQDIPALEYARGAP